MFPHCNMRMVIPALPPHSVSVSLIITLKSRSNILRTYYFFSGIICILSRLILILMLEVNSLIIPVLQIRTLINRGDGPRSPWLRTGGAWSWRQDLWVQKLYGIMPTKAFFCKLKRSQKYMRLILCLGLIYRTTLESTSYLCLPNVAFLAGPFLSGLRKLHSFSCEAFPTKTFYVAFPDGSGSLASLSVGSRRSLVKSESSTSR